MKFTSINWPLFFLCTMIIVISCQQKEVIDYPETHLADTHIIPKPESIVETNSAFGLDQFTEIKTSSNDSAYQYVAQYLSEQINQKISLRVPVNSLENKDIKRVIYIQQSDDPLLKSQESYLLEIRVDSLIVTAVTAEGAFRALQTIEQIIPVISNDTITDHSMWLIPSGKIIDNPYFSYRGAMLDVARHFFSVEEVKKYIDALVYYKINILHLHLTDDQGWRIEIKSWPKLTTVGGATEVGGGKGGYFTQNDYKELIRYASERYITIVPEIDMPGHTNAASLAYPILNGNGKKIKAYTGMRVGFSTWDARKDTVYTFVDDVVREISAMTPGPYFHIGGDESHVTQKSDYIYFISKVEKIVERYGKRMIGWDEITQSKRSNRSIAQHWQNPDHAVQAAKDGLQIIMSPAPKAYLDMKYNEQSEYGLDWAGHVPIDTAYNWYPTQYIDGVTKADILGVEAPLWSETISNSSELEYLAFPRIIGHAEIGWSVPQNRNWKDYKIRLAHQSEYLKRKGINYYKSKLVDWK